MPEIGELSTVAAYVFLFALVFAESGILLGFFLPGDTVLLAAGVLSGRGPLSLPILIVIVLVAAVSGDAVGYAIGRRGLPLVRGRAARHLATAERFYARYGEFAVVAARWIPWVRTFTPLLAGAARMPYRRFLPANVVGALCWGAGLLVLGYLLGT